MFPSYNPLQIVKVSENCQNKGIRKVFDVESLPPVHREDVKITIII
jgi:hypothetical protein